MFPIPLELDPGTARIEHLEGLLATACGLAQGGGAPSPAGAGTGLQDRWVVSKGAARWVRL